VKGWTWASINTIPPAFVPRSEATQCVTLYSRQGTTDTIDEVEDEQDQGEDKRRQQQGLWESQQLDKSEGAEGGGWSDAEPKEEVEEEEDKVEEEERKRTKKK